MPFNALVKGHQTIQKTFQSIFVDCQILVIDHIGNAKVPTRTQFHDIWCARCSLPMIICQNAEADLLAQRWMSAKLSNIVFNEPTEENVVIVVLVFGDLSAVRCVPNCEDCNLNVLPPRRSINSSRMKEWVIYSIYLVLTRTQNQKKRRAIDFLIFQSMSQVLRFSC